MKVTFGTLKCFKDMSIILLWCDFNIMMQTTVTTRNNIFTYNSKTTLVNLNLYFTWILLLKYIIYIDHNNNFLFTCL